MQEIHRSTEAEAASRDRSVCLGHQFAAARGDLIEHPIAPAHAIRVALEDQEAPPLLVEQSRAKMRTTDVDSQNVAQENLRTAGASSLVPGCVVGIRTDSASTVTSGTYLPMSRWRTLVLYPSCTSLLATSSVKKTDRCRPPVQPIAMVK